LYRFDGVGQAVVKLQGVLPTNGDGEAYNRNAGGSVNVKVSAPLKTNGEVLNFACSP